MFCVDVYIPPDMGDMCMSPMEWVCRDVGPGVGLVEWPLAPLAVCVCGAHAHAWIGGCTACVHPHVCLCVCLLICTHVPLPFPGRLESLCCREVGGAGVWRVRGEMVARRASREGNREGERVEGREDGEEGRTQRE